MRSLPFYIPQPFRVLIFILGVELLNEDDYLFIRDVNGSGDATKDQFFANKQGFRCVSRITC